jgi:hypothetical protein
MKYWYVEVPITEGKFESMTFPSETSCRLQWMFYGKEETKK